MFAMLLQIAGPVASFLVAVLVFALNRRAAQADRDRDDVTERIETLAGELRDALTRLAADLRGLAGTVSNHETRLARGDGTFERFQGQVADLSRRLDGLESRERERGCFVRCAARAPESK